MSYSGFTMLEVLVVMGIFTLASGFALFVSSETYRGSNFRTDRDLLVTALQRARAQAVNNVCLEPCADNDGKPHGVHIESDTYVLFQDNGSGYDAGDSQNAVFASNTTVAKSPTSLDVIFEQLSGESTSATMTLTGGGKTSVITISEEGQISWTN
jgi:prepilin-type N-terminal cleavage/methylation domain-containing protein